jgi:membrane protein YqaA with SNARE-associated domain
VSSLAELLAPARLGRGLRWLLASSWITYLGDGITLAAGPLLVASQTLNPLTIAMAAFFWRFSCVIALTSSVRDVGTGGQRVGVVGAEDQHLVG